MSTRVDQVLNTSPVMPVLVIKRIEDAVPLAKALVAGGMNVLEVTLRTPVALDAIKAISAEVEGAIVGAGTVTRVAELQEVQRAGGVFAISPGATPSLLQAGLTANVAYLPAVSTVSEIMLAVEAGYNAFKFFPAESNGGIAALKSIYGPFPDIRFCPTGGISPDNFLDYLALPNVSCVGGSWVVPAELVDNQDWAGISRLAAEAVATANAAKAND